MPAEFWPRHLAEHPLDAPATLRAPLPAPLLQEPELWALLVAAAESTRRGLPRELRLYLGDARMVWRQTVEQRGLAFFDLLPRPADRSLAGYGERLSRKHGAACFAIILNNCAALSPALWFRVRDFTHGLLEHVGFPAGGVDANLFAGNYRRTPFGVHTDDRDVFTWVVSGPKRFLAWPWQTLAKVLGPQARTPRSPHAYGDYRARAHKLAGKQGDLLYWPKEYWHVAEAGRGALSSTLSIGLDHRLPARGWVQAALAEQLGENASEALMSRAALRGPAQELASELPARLRRALGAVRAPSLVARLERELRLGWMAWVSGIGLAAPARAVAPTLRVSDLLQRDVRYPICWQEWRGELLCAANGYSLSIPTWSGAVDFLRALNASSVVRARDVLSLTGSREHQGRQRALLEMLLSFRAVQHAPS